MNNYFKVVASAVALTMTACQPQQQAATGTARADHSAQTQSAKQSANSKHQLNHQLLSEKGHYLVKWQPIAQDRIPLNQYFALDVHLSEPLKPANYPLELSLNAGMQAHNHGMHTKPIIKRHTNQHFVIEGMLFHMPGTWQIEFAISRGIIRDTAKLEVVL